MAPWKIGGFQYIWRWQQRPGLRSSLGATVRDLSGSPAVGCLLDSICFLCDCGCMFVDP